MFTALRSLQWPDDCKNNLYSRFVQTKLYKIEHMMIIDKTNAFSLNKILLCEGPPGGGGSLYSDDMDDRRIF